MRFHAHSRTHDIVALGGWLFADLLLALAMLFFISGVVITPPVKKPIPTPTPPSQPRLELNHQRIVITIDPGGILGDNPAAIQSVEQQIRVQAVLRNRSAGLVIAYGGAPTLGLINTAVGIANKIYAILKELGRQRYVFDRASYYDPLYLLGGAQSLVTLDIYLFAR